MRRPSLLYICVTLTLLGITLFSQESYSKADIDPQTGKPLDVGISGLEGKGSAKGNDGFFEKGLMSALESNHRAMGGYREVKVIANGHSHRTSVLHIVIYVDSSYIRVAVTENCRRIKGIWMCFGGGGYVWCSTAPDLWGLTGFVLSGHTPAMEKSASIAGSGFSTSRIMGRPFALINGLNTTRSWMR